MSGVGPSELLVLVVIGLLILGPERLPRVATQIGRWVGRARRTANQLRYQLEREITLADIEEKKKKKDKDAAPKNPGDAPAPDEAGESEDSTLAGTQTETESDVKPEDGADVDSDDEAKDA